MDRDTVVEAAEDAYRLYAEYVTENVDLEQPMLPWRDLPKVYQCAWVSATVAVLDRAAPEWWRAS